MEVWAARRRLPGCEWCPGCALPALPSLERHQGPQNPGGIFWMGFRPRRGSCSPQSHAGAGQHGSQWDGPSSCKTMSGPRSSSHRHCYQRWTLVVGLGQERGSGRSAGPGELNAHPMGSATSGATSHSHFGHWDPQTHPCWLLVPCGTSQAEGFPAAFFMLQHPTPLS